MPKVGQLRAGREDEMRELAKVLAHREGELWAMLVKVLVHAGALRPERLRTPERPSMGDLKLAVKRLLDGPDWRAAFMQPLPHTLTGDDIPF